MAAVLISHILPAERPVEKSTLSFSVFPLDRDVDGSGIFFAPDGNPANGMVELSFNTRHRSSDYVYKGSEPLIFFRRERTQDGGFDFQIVARLSFHTRSHDNPYILFFSTMENSDRLSVLVMEDDPARFSKNSLVFINTLPVTLRCAFGGNVLALQPGLSRPFQLGSYFEEPVPVIFAVDENSSMRMVLGRSFHFSSGRRYFLILRRSDLHTPFRVSSQLLSERIPGDPRTER